VKRSLLNWRSLFVFAGLAVVITAICLSLGGTSQKAQEREGSSSTFERFSAGDNVTSVIRDRSKDLARVVTGSAADKESAAKYGTIVQDYGSFVIVAKKKGVNIPASRLASQPMETSLNLPSGKFEPLSEQRPEAVRPGAEAPGSAGWARLRLKKSSPAF
jgi:hypothetical protein